MENDQIPYLTKEEDDKVWNNAFIMIRRKEKQKRQRKIITFGGMAAIVIFGSSVLGYNHLIKPDVYIADLDNLKVVLSDKSEVILQKGAKLTVEKSFQSVTRDVNLEGDAIFKISKSKEHPFIVHGNGYETKVLGTVFKVSQNGKAFVVDLYEGKVQVYKKGHQNESLSLEPQQSFRNFGNTKVATVTQTEAVSVNRADLSSLSLTDCPLSEAVNVAEKTYGINISYPAELKQAKVTLFQKNVTADAFIRKLAIQLNLTNKKNSESEFQLER